MRRPESTLEELLSEVDDLLTQARSSRRAWSRFSREAEIASQNADLPKAAECQSAAEAALTEAEKSLTRAMLELEWELREREADPGAKPTDMAASEDRKQLAIRLADCYGPLGGIARRRSDYRHAVELYAKGSDLERSNVYGITSTYNRVQWIVSRILLDPASITDPDDDLDRQANQLIDEMLRNDARDVWVSADVYLLSVILGRRRVERDEWLRLRRSTPVRDLYESGLLVLIELSRKLPHNGLLAEAIAKYNSQLPSELRKLA